MSSRSTIKKCAAGCGVVTNNHYCDDCEEAAADVEGLNRDLAALLLARWAEPWEEFFSDEPPGAAYYPLARYAGIIVDEWRSLREQIKTEPGGLVYIWEAPAANPENPDRMPGMTTIGYYNTDELLEAACSPSGRHECPDFADAAKQAFKLCEDGYDHTRQIILGARIRSQDNLFLEPTVVDLPGGMWLAKGRRPHPRAKKSRTLSNS